MNDEYEKNADSHALEQPDERDRAGEPLESSEVVAHTQRIRGLSNDEALFQALGGMLESCMRSIAEQTQVEERAETERARIAEMERSKRHAAELPLRQEEQANHYRAMRNMQVLGGLVIAGVVALIALDKGDTVKDLLQGVALVLGGAGALQLYVSKTGQKPDPDLDK